VPTGTAARARSLIPLKKPQPLMTKPDEHHHDSSHTEPERVPAVGQTRPRPPTDQPTVPLWTRDFTNLTYEWRRLFSELFGSFLLVMAAAGGPVIQNRSLGQIGRVAEVTAPALTVLAVILFMGAVSGAHLNPIVSVAFALRRDFQWRRVPGYILAQVLGAVLATLLLRVTFGDVAHLGATLPGAGFTSGQAFIIEVVLSCGLVSTILGTASSAQNVGTLSAVGVGAYIGLAGLWASPVSGASMNPARSLGPALGAGDLHHLWIYLSAPPLGMLIAVAAAQILRGPGGDPDGRRAADGTLPDAAAGDETSARDNR
jgi:aquaporin Z